MYITNTTDEVKKLFESIGELNDISKLKIILYAFGLLNNDQINSKNEVNPNLEEDEELQIFNMQSLGFSNNYCTIFLQYNVMLYNAITKTKNVYEDNGNVIGLKYDENEKKIIKNFENLSFKEKLDVFSELIIEYDNETYFKEKITMVTFSSEEDGFSIAKRIQNIKENI